MITRSSLLHLRIPFSLFLMPVYLFALGLTPNLQEGRMLWVFLALHLFLYPSSNGYNSYYDRDTDSIGGLKVPPKVTGDLLGLSLGFFVLAMGIAALVNWAFVSMVCIYGLVSMAYSHPLTRWKRFPWWSWLIAGSFQGYFTFAMAYAGLSDFGWEIFLKPHVLVPGFLTSLMLWGNYPLTQVYQHAEDARRGDLTLSRTLGIKGTFAFSAACFALAGAGFAWFFVARGQQHFLWAFLGALMPVFLYFLLWFYFVKKDPSRYANYSWAMGMNWISALCLISFFVYFFLENTQILQVFGSY